MQSCKFRLEKFTDYYECHEIIGAGAFSKVVRATNKETFASVAIKFVGKKDLDSTDKKHLLNEIRICMEIDHPNVVKLLEVFENPQYFLLVLELMNGGDLLSRVTERGHFSESEAASALKPILDGVIYCHSRGIIHRDIKPENILYEDDSENSLVKICDFGIARMLQPNEMATTDCGTLCYMAPEIIQAKKYGSSCDVWSLGVVLFVMLCGYAPFESDDLTQAKNNIVNGVFEFASPYWDGISSQAKDLLSKMLVVNPEKRITVHEVLNHPWMVGHLHTQVEMITE